MNLVGPYSKPEFGTLLEKGVKKQKYLFYKQIVKGSLSTLLLLSPCSWTQKAGFLD